MELSGQLEVNPPPQTNLGSAEEKKKEEKPKVKKSKKTEFYYQLHHVMNDFNISGWQDFPQNFHVVCDKKGIRMIIEEDDQKVCHYVDDAKVIHAILDYCYKFLADKKAAALDHSEATQCFKLWRALTPPIDEDVIKPIAQKSEDVLCWHRLPFDICEGTETPTFAEMFSRISNGKALKAFIGSLFFKEASREQYAWVYGHGRNGKGALARFLHAVMGPTYGAQQPPQKGDRFWLSGLLGVRLAMFADCEDADFPGSGIFKSLTGGDLQRIEEKGKPIYTASLQCKCMFMSNDTPRLTSQTSDIRRAIYCEAQPISQNKIPTHIYDGMLWNEAPSFLHECIELYKEYCPEHGDIPVESQELDAIIDANEEPFQIFLDKHFMIQAAGEKDEHGNTRPTREQWALSGARLQEIISEDKSFDFKKRIGLIKYFEIKHSIKRKSVRLEDGKVRKLYVGIREKNAAEKSMHDASISGKHDKF